MKISEVLNEEDEEAKAQRKHEQCLAKTAARKEAFTKSPAWFTIWDITGTILKVFFWLCFWSLVVQCDCKCLLK